MEGKCLCESVSIKSVDTEHVEACHCGMCRRWGGGPFLSVHGGAEIEISGEHSVSRFSSSEWAERAFCSRCGTHLFYHLKGANEYFIPVGLFQNESNFSLKQQTFIDKKPGYYEFLNETEKLTEEQVFQKYAQ